jgi:hypothetical protein
MHVLVATSTTQGRVEGDYCFTIDGELVTTPVDTCDCPDCGCSRGMSGLSSSTGTTTFMVEDRDLDGITYRSLVRDALSRQGWLSGDPETDDWFDDFVNRQLMIASFYAPGTVLSIVKGQVMKRSDLITVATELRRLRAA